MKRNVTCEKILLILLLFAICFTCSCGKNKKQGKMPETELIIEEESVYDEIHEEGPSISGSYDQNGDGFVDGWY